MAKKTNKRGNGEGSITQRPDGRWECKIMYGTNEAGKPLRKSLYAKTRAEVQKKKEEFLSQVANGSYVHNNQTLLADWLNRWLNVYAKPKLRITTFEAYETVLRVQINPAIGHLLLKNIRPEHIQCFYNEKAANGRLDGSGGLSAETIHRIHTILNQAFEQAMKEGLLARNVCKLVNKPRIEVNETRPFTVDEANHFLRAAKSNKYFPAFLLEWGTGLRRGELLALRWRDVDLDNGVISVRRSLSRTRSQGLIFTEPKTRRSIRTIPISNDIVLELRRYKTLQDSHKEQMGTGYVDQDLVFANECGGPVEPRAFTRVFERLLEKAELRRIKFHDMRHGFATMMLQLNEHPKTVQALMGHATANVTLDRYTYVDSSLLKQATTKLGHLLSLDSNEPSKIHETAETYIAS